MTSSQFTKFTIHRHVWLFSYHLTLCSRTGCSQQSAMYGGQSLGGRQLVVGGEVWVAGPRPQQPRTRGGVAGGGV